MPGDVVVDETSPPGGSFLAQVCVAWEAAAAEAPVRHVAVRNSLVVGRGAQAVRLTALPYRFFVGGPAGGGRQWFPWVHLDDAVRLYRLAIDDESLEGALDAVAPEQLRQRDAARIFGQVLHRPALVPTPGFALRLMLGEQADLVLHGQRAVSREARRLRVPLPRAEGGARGRPRLIPYTSVTRRRILRTILSGMRQVGGSRWLRRSMLLTPIAVVAIATVPTVALR